jgi:ubiquitin-protein ligase
MAAKRVGRDIKNMLELQNMGIFYSYDEANMMTGQAIVIGPEGTPYAHSPLLFSIKIPSNYPFVSPSVEIQTSDGVTRFHPNLYVTGKVCLSILGTYSGPKWSSIMTLDTIFISIHSLLNDNPITNEPGWENYTLDDPRAVSYAECVKFNLAKYTVYEHIRYTKSATHPWRSFDGFEEMWRVRWEALKKMIVERANGDDMEFVNIPYGMKGRTDWKRLAEVASSSCSM